MSFFQVFRKVEWKISGKIYGEVIVVIIFVDCDGCVEKKFFLTDVIYFANYFFSSQLTGLHSLMKWYGLKRDDYMLVFLL